jgi:predicted AlkP superfamily pyrophosphatase or phosphodiesterase
MSRRLLSFFLVLLLIPTTAPRAATPPEPPTAASGDAIAGAEPAGLNAGEWAVAVQGSSTDATPKGALQALLEKNSVDLVAFYKNLDESVAANADDAYHVLARRPRDINDDSVPDLVIDHLVYTRTATPDGRFNFHVVSLTAENPVGTALPGVTPLNPLGLPNGPGPVTVADQDDAKRDPRVLATLADEIAAATDSVTETTPASENGVVRHFIPPENTAYPYPYERLAAVFDDSDGPDLLYVPTPSGAGGPRGTHGSLDVTQSRTTLVVSGRAARRTPLDPADEAALEIHNVDVAPTVAKVLGVPVHTAAQYLNNGDASENPSAPPALLRRQDGKPIDALLEPRVNTFVVVIDGMIPENLNATLTPNLCDLSHCPGAVLPDPDTRATVYTQARAMMVTQTNGNHVAMMTGAYGETSGVFGNSYWNRLLNASQPLENPELLLAPTLFDAFRAQAPHLTTAAVLGKGKLRRLFDCTKSGSACGTNSSNPEGIPITHVRPDYLRGASTSPVPGSDDCPAESASGSDVALDACVMDGVIRLSATQDPDFTFVNLANVDAFQHVDGPNTPAGTLAIADADAQIGRLVSYLKESGKWKSSVLIVTADHSFSLQGPPPANRIDLASLFNADRTANPLAWGLNGGVLEPFAVVSNGGTAQVVLTNVPTGATTLTQAQYDALKRMREVARFSAPAVPRAGISEAWYRLENPMDPGQTLSANRPDWHLDTPRVGELLVTVLASGPTAPLGGGGNAFETPTGTGYTLSAAASASGAIPGDHGHPGARHVPFLILSGGNFVKSQVIGPSNPGAVNEGDDTGALPEQAENVDIAATVAWIHGLIPSSANDASALLPASSGRVLKEAFEDAVPPIEAVEPHANRAIVMIFDANNSVRIHEFLARPDQGKTTIPSVRSLLFKDTDGRADAPNGLLTRYGSISAFPSVTFPNHNVVGSGAFPGHHGIVNNNYYERDIETERDPIDPTDPRNPAYFGSSALLRADFETLHEAVHRAFGDWDPITNPGGAFTASVDEPSARGADFASLETLDDQAFPAAFAALTANPAFLTETNQVCAQEDPSNYGLESVLDHQGTAQAISLYSDPTIVPVITPGVVRLVNDTSAGANHPDPKYLIENFTLTDGAAHFAGPHAVCGQAGYVDTDKRFGRVLAELRNHSRYANDGEPARAGETFLLLTGDHGMENQDLRPGKGGGFNEALTPYDIEFVNQGDMLYLLTLDVQALGVPAGGLKRGFPATLTFVVRDDDQNADGSPRPIAGATVRVTSGPSTAIGITDALGRATLTFTAHGTQARVLVDKDATPDQGARTIGDTSPVPLLHGKVTKTVWNDRELLIPVVP